MFRVLVVPIPNDLHRIWLSFKYATHSQPLIRSLIAVEQKQQNRLVQRN